MEYTPPAKARHPDEGPVLWMVSHCRTSSQREVYARELSKHIKVRIPPR